MTIGRIEALKGIFKPAFVRLGAPLAVAGTVWDWLSSQFNWPTLGSILGLGRDLIPTWAWFYLLLLLMFFGLFEYVRLGGGREAAHGLAPPSNEPQVTKHSPAPTTYEVPVVCPPAPPPVEPDMRLIEVAVRVAGHNTGMRAPEVEREIADKVLHRGLSVWARSGNQPLRQLTTQQLESATFKPSSGAVSYPGMVEAVKLEDVRLVRAQVDEVWPPKEDQKSRA